jgi:hypothetical protein
MNGITLKASEKIASKDQTASKDRCYLGSARQTREVSAYHDENYDGMIIFNF